MRLIHWRFRYRRRRIIMAAAILSLLFSPLLYSSPASPPHLSSPKFFCSCPPYSPKGCANSISQHPSKLSMWGSDQSCRCPERADYSSSFRGGKVGATAEETEGAEIGRNILVADPVFRSIPPSIPARSVVVVADVDCLADQDKGSS